jgi:polysaccharide biosynthesis protein PslJ
MTVADPGRVSPSPARLYLIAGSLALLAASIVSGVFTRPAVALVALATVVAVSGVRSVSWPRLVAVLILIILMVPIRRYELPGNLPFEVEPYRVFVLFLVFGWCASVLVDARTNARRTGFEGPLIVIVGAMVVSVLANLDRVAASSADVAKSLTFFLSFVLVLYMIAGAVRRFADVDFLAKVLVVGGALVAVFAIVEARTGFNVFNHLDRVIPILYPGAVDPGNFVKYGAAKLRVFASAQHPIALSAAFVLLLPLAIYLAHRYRQRRWIVCAFLLVAACASAVSRTGIVMLLVVGVVFLWLRPRETSRLWPAIVPLLVVIHFVLPGTLGAIKQSFFPAGGLIAEQKSNPGGSGSGRLADLGPAIDVWERQPIVGQGFGTILVTRIDVHGEHANILDDQWLGTLLATGLAGVIGWFWFFARAVRRFGREARRDKTDRGWLLASIAAAVAAFAVGMLTYDAFAFIQATFLLFILVGLGAALLAEPRTPVAVETLTSRRAPPPRRPIRMARGEV